MVHAVLVTFPHRQSFTSAWIEHCYVRQVLPGVVARVASASDGVDVYVPEHKIVAYELLDVLLAPHIAIDAQTTEIPYAPQVD